MNTFIETYRPFSNGPVLFRVVKPFVANDFEFAPINIEGALEASETYTGKTSRERARAKRHVSGYRRVELTEETTRTLLVDLSEVWKDGTDYRGKAYKRRWLEPASGIGQREVPGFDGTFMEWQAQGISHRVELVAKARDPEKRQLEIDATRERVRREVEGAVPMADWVETYNEKWREYADWTEQRLIEYVGELVKDVRVKDDWLEENMSGEDTARIRKMQDEIVSLDDQIKALRERKQALRQRIYDKDRRVLETSLTNTQDPVLKAVFDAAIESVKDQKSGRISHPIFD